MWEVTFKSLLLILQFVGLATNLVVFKKPPLQKGTLHNGKGPNKKNKSNTNMSLFSATTLSQKGIPLINGSQIKAKARSTAETFIMESTSKLRPPPLEDKTTGLYILLSEIDIVMDRKILEKPKNNMAFLMKLETDGTLSNLLVLTFGPWYFYPLMSTLQLLYHFWFIICSNFVYFLLVVTHPTSWWKD